MSFPFGAKAAKWLEFGAIVFRTLIDGKPVANDKGDLIDVRSWIVRLFHEAVSALLQTIEDLVVGGERTEHYYRNPPCHVVLS